MTSRYHTPTAITKCPRCGKPMKMGERVNVAMHREMGDRRKRWMTAKLVCRECGDKVADFLGLERGPA